MQQVKKEAQAHIDEVAGTRAETESTLQMGGYVWLYRIWPKGKANSILLASNRYLGTKGGRAWRSDLTQLEFDVPCNSIFRALWGTAARPHTAASSCLQHKATVSKGRAFQSLRGFRW